MILCRNSLPASTPAGLDPESRVSQGLSRQWLDQKVQENEREVEILEKETTSDIFDSVYGQMKQDYTFALTFFTQSLPAIKDSAVFRNNQLIIWSAGHAGITAELNGFDSG